MKRRIDSLKKCLSPDSSDIFSFSDKIERFPDKIEKPLKTTHTTGSSQCGNDWGPSPRFPTSRMGIPLRASVRIVDSSPHQAQKDIESFFQRAFFAPLWGRNHISGFSKDPSRPLRRELKTTHTTCCAQSCDSCRYDARYQLKDSLPSFFFHIA